MGLELNQPIVNHPYRMVHIIATQCTAVIGK